MGNGALYMEEEKNKCFICKDELTQSYFMGLKQKGTLVLKLAEVCPECHHYFTYGTPELIEQYKKRRGIKL